MNVHFVAFTLTHRDCFAVSGFRFWQHYYLAVTHILATAVLTVAGQLANGPMDQLAN